MLHFFGNARIFLYNDPINMRNSFEGLSKVLEKVFSEKLTEGSFFVFLNKKQDRMKILYWDIDGLAIWYKRLEKGKFLKRTSTSEINRREFFMLLEGITPQKLQRRYSLF